MKTAYLILALAQAASASGTRLSVAPSARASLTLPAAPFNLAQLERFALDLQRPGQNFSPLPIESQVRGNPALIGRLVEMARQAEPAQAVGALYLLAASRAPEAWEAMDSLLDKNTDPALYPVFYYRHFLEDPQKAFRLWAQAPSRSQVESPAWWLETMGFFDHPEFLPQLEEALRRPDWSEAWKVPVAGLAARLGSGLGARVLLDLSRSGKPEAPAALEAMGEAINRFSQAAQPWKEQFTQELMGRLYRGSPDERVAAAKGLSQLQEALDPEARRRAEYYLSDSWDSFSDPQKQIPYIRALGRIGSEKVVPLLHRVMRHEHFELREAAARARHQIWARRDFEDPEKAKTVEINDETAVMVPALLIDKSAPADPELLDWAIRNQIIKPIMSIELSIPTYQGRIITGLRKQVYQGDKDLEAKYRALGYPMRTLLFMVPMKNPRNAEKFSPIHGRSFYRVLDRGAAVMKNVGGVKLNKRGGLSILFDEYAHGHNDLPGLSAAVASALQNALVDARHNPALRLARRFGAGRGIFLRHIAEFMPISIPAWEEKTKRVVLLPYVSFKRGRVFDYGLLPRLFPGVEFHPLFLYQTPVPIRTEEMGSIRDSLHAVINWMHFFNLAASQESFVSYPELAAKMLLRIAVRKAVLSYIFHQHWGVAMGYPDPTDHVLGGNQILSTHNKNPWTHFDGDSAFLHSPARLGKHFADPKAAVREQIARERHWLLKDIQLLGEDVLLTAREVMSATALFFHVLLADKLEGAASDPQDPPWEKRSPILSQ